MRRAPSKNQPITMSSSSSSDSDLEDYDWKELSKEQKKAAETLGYNKKMWDKGGKPQTEDLDWDELTPEQQEAAKVLGYNKEKWDAD